jgi:hypothetical protein
VSAIRDARCGRCVDPVVGMGMQGGTLHANGIAMRCSLSLLAQMCPAVLARVLPIGPGGLQHDISTEVFGRAYLEVRAGYFTH